MENSTQNIENQTINTVTNKNFTMERINNTEQRLREIYEDRYDGMVYSSTTNHHHGLNTFSTDFDGLMVGDFIRDFWGMPLCIIKIDRKKKTVDTVQNNKWNAKFPFGNVIKNRSFAGGLIEVYETNEKSSM